MSVLNILYTLIIYPPLLFIEICFELFLKVFRNPGIAVLGVSAAITFLCLPLYIVAERWQEAERNIQKRLAPKVAKIKAVFKGDERYMILSTYYRQNNYHPVYALRSSFGILIQIPFFIAAYSYLSNLGILKGVPFLFIHDLGAPDAFARIGGFTVNILPILMTLINIVSGIIYTKGFPFKDRIQLFGMAGVFLILLYNSPAALVIFWTANNIFSMIKNIFYKLKNPLKVLYIISASIVVVLVFYLIFINREVLNKRLLVIAASSLVLFTPLFVKFFLYFHRKFLPVLTENPRKMNLLFIFCCLALAILTGLSVPTAVISSSPGEFSFLQNNTGPLSYPGYSFLSSLGLFLVWPVCVYFLFGKRIKSLLTFFFGILLFGALINAFVFQGNYEQISNTFQFPNTGVLHSSPAFSILNALALLLSVFLFVLALKKRLLSLLVSLSLIVVISLGAFSIYNIFRIQKGFLRIKAAMEKEGAVHTLEKVFSLSRDKPNIIIIMADRGINSYAKPVFENRPELYDDFEGFILYPNTVSFSNHTVMGVPPLWGGFEYTPMEMNKRDTLPLKEKHNQAILLLPTILTEKDFEVTVADSSMANYEWISDLSIFDGLENMKAFNTIGRYTSYWFQNNIERESDSIRRNCLFFSFLKITPPPLRFVVYDKGQYLSAVTKGNSIDNFIDNYAVLDYLPELTSFDAEKSQALFITNEIAHHPFFLQYPDYEPMLDVTDYGPEPFNNNKDYHSNAALIIRLSKWFKALKNEGVYDNTRIIIAADHGGGPEPYNPLLMVKDFNSREKLSENSLFMTNADVPLLALNGIVDNPVNPFTGNLLSSDYKNEGVYITDNHQFMIANHGRYTFNIKEDQWIFVKDSVKDDNLR